MIYIKSKDDMMNTKFLSFSFSLAAVMALSGCGGSGSSPTPSPQPSIPVPIDTNTTIDTNVTIVVVPIEPVVPYPGYVAGVDYTDPSQFVQTSGINANLQAVGADMAHNNGFTGGNLSETTAYTTVTSDTSDRNLQTIVAVLDSGINANHMDFNSTGKIEAWKDFSATNSPTPYDDIGHGTVVSSIIAGNKDVTYDDQEYGIAYGAHLVVGQIMTNGMTDSFVVKEGIDWVVAQKQTLDINNSKKLVALNLSLGTTDSSFVDPSFKTSLINALNTGMSIVLAAGNEGLDCLPNNGSINGKCGFPAAAPWVGGSADTDYFNKDGGWVVVGSVDSNNNISTFSNRAGVTKSNFLVVPGENIHGASNVASEFYVVGFGTSFATPLVSGALALMAQKWPHLNGRQHTDVLFTTATDLGDVGVDDIYGNGLMNLTTAFSPVGTLALPTSLQNVSARTAGNTAALASTTLRTSSAMATLSSFAPINETIGIDNFNRDFKMNMTGSIATSGTSPVNFEQFLSFNYKNLIFGVDQRQQLPMLGYNFGKGLQAVATVDNKTLLGMEGSGAFATGSAMTAYANVKKSFTSDDGLLASIEGTYAYGKANAQGSSLISDVSTVQAVGGKAKLSYSGFGYSYEVPLRVVSGDMTFTAPTGIDNGGDVTYTSMNASLSPDTFQQTNALFYEASVNGLGVYAELGRTSDAFGIAGLIDNKARISLNYWY
jgi:subtilisin family serine protease